MFLYNALTNFVELLKYELGQLNYFENILNQLKKETAFIEGKLRMFKEENKVIEAIQNEICYENLIQVVSEDKFDTEATSSYNTLCSCKSNCHISCGLKILPSGSKKFQECDAFSNSINCNECDHDYSTHFHDYFKFVKVTIEKEIRVNGILEKYSLINYNEQLLKNKKILKKKAEEELSKDIKIYCQNIDFYVRVIKKIYPKYQFSIVHDSLWQFEDILEEEYLNKVDTIINYYG